MSYEPLTFDIPFVKTDPNARVPMCADEGSAGYDLFACLDGESIVVPARKSVLVSTGIAVELPAGTFGAIFPRSGMATKSHIRLSNSVAVIDSSYRGTIFVSLMSDSGEDVVIENGERIAQLVLMPFFGMNFVEADKLSETARGAGGFGSTGRG